VLDYDNRRLQLDIPPDELTQRMEALTPAKPIYRRGYGALYVEHVLQADEGCDFDFLRRRDDEPIQDLPLGLLEGWHGGW
jgi:dihydroxy-acid dehydratase